jgi:hypothetical protein
MAKCLPYILSVLILFCANFRGAAASLSGTMTDLASGTTLSLSATGSLDWVHLGFDSVSTLNRKISANPRISAPVTLDGLNPAMVLPNSIAFAWTNGTPVIAATTANGLAVTNVGNGFEFTVAADTTTKWVQVFVGSVSAGAAIEVTLSDSSAPAYADSWTSVELTNRAYVFSYGAASAQQTLRVRVTMTSASETNAAVMLNAMALTRVGTNQPPSISIANPASDASVPAGDIVINTVTADNDGAVTRVEFLDNGIKFGETTNAPFSFLWTNAALGLHSLTARVFDDEGTNRTSSAVTFFVMTNGGSVAGALSVPTGTVNLTLEGAADWVHWGYITDSTVTRKAGVTPLISNVTLIGSGPWYQFADNFNGYTWTDGTPIAQANATLTGIYLFGLNNGFEIQAPADTSVRTLRIHVGTYAARGRLRAFVNDASAPMFADTSVFNSGNGPGGIYSVTYRAASAGKKLIVRYTVASTVAGDGNVTLQAATLVTENNPPLATLTSPTNGAVFNVGSAIPLTATATDSDGSVARVEFLANGNVVAISSNAPFSALWTNAAAGAHVITARAVDNLDATHVSAPAAIAVITGGGYLRGNINPTAPLAANLSAEGSIDWAHWGLVNKSSFNRLSGGPARISNVNEISGSSARYANNYTAFTWTNGSPTASVAGTRTGLYVEGLSNGFTMTVSADRSVRRLRVYAGLYGARSRFDASLSDNSAAPFVDTSLARTYSSGYAVYTVDFAAASTNQQLRIRYTADTIYDTAYGNVTWQAATLSPFTTLISVAPDANGFSGSFNAFAGVPYIVEFTDAVPTNSWQVLTNILGNGSNAVFADPAPLQPQRFYRVRAN